MCVTPQISRRPGRPSSFVSPKWSSGGCALGKDLTLALKCTIKIEYLNESAVVLRGKLTTSFAKGDHFNVMDYLTTALATQIRSSLSRDPKDFDEPNLPP